MNDQYQPFKGYIYEIVNRNLLKRQEFAWKRKWTGCQWNLLKVRKKGPIRNTDRIHTMPFSHTVYTYTQTHIPFHSFIRSYFDVIKWKPYKNWVAPVTPSHIAGRRVIIHSILFLFSCFFFLLFFSLKGWIKKSSSRSRRSSSSSNKKYTANKPLTTCEIRE